MEGLSKITYKNKTILYADYSNFGESIDKTLNLINGVAEEYLKSAPKSVLALINVTNLHFDSKVLDAFKNTRAKTDPYEKKTAIIGTKGLLKVAYNIVVGLTQRNVAKVFDSELDAKEWLVSD